MDDPSMWRDIVPVISAITALVAVVVGPFVAWKVAKRQINATNISSKRQVWIDDLRQDVAETLGLLSYIEGLRRPSPDLSREEELEVFDRKMEAEVRALELLLRIKLRLNPNEQDHNNLVAAFEKLAKASPDPRQDETVEQISKLQARFASARDHVLTVTAGIAVCSATSRFRSPSL